MPTSVPGNRRYRRYRRISRIWHLRCIGRRRRDPAAAQAQRGFTLIELLLVLAIIAISVGVVSFALRDGNAARLDEEGARLAALLEMGRAEARVTGGQVLWVPTPDGTPSPDGGATPPTQFRFLGLAASQPLPTRWLDAATRAQIVGGVTVVLGPDAILPPQRIVLRLGDQRLDLASDGLGPFAPSAASP